MKQTIYHICLAVCVMACVMLMLTSCEQKQQVVQRIMKTDSLLNVAHHAHDYERILALVDSGRQAGTLSDQKACYWEGYAYSREHKTRLAEKAWREAVGLPVESDEDLAYYSMSANRLAGLLYVKSDYEGTIRVALKAMKLMKERNYTINTDYANLHTFVGNCQLKLGHLGEAASNFSLAYQHYEQVIEADHNIANYTSSIVGIINIVNAYIQIGNYPEANEWINRFDTMLKRYREQPQADDLFIDKQWARLNFYRGWVLEGMDRKAEARKAYQAAARTNYAKTADGQMEATGYLIAARRWGEAADKFQVLDGVLSQFDAKMTLDNIHTYLLPKLRANMGAHRTDSALAVAMWIHNVLDSAIVWERQNAAIELATIYDTQQKETEIMEQKATLSHQRFLTTVITLVAVILAFSLFIYFRHASAMRLERAYHALEIANARAEESSRIKSEFIQQISHEIRTPLNILSGFTQVITTPDMELDEATREDINRQITENTNRITGLVNKMLELSDVKSKTVIEQNDDVSVEQIALEATEASGITSAKHLTFDIQLPEEAETVMLHTNQQAAVRALSLILDNARKFTAPSKAKKGVQEKTARATLRLLLTDDTVEFVVEDTGIGVPPEEVDRIFEEFVQLDEFYDGTGIGLTVARSLSRRLGGDVVLDTSYTGGARFVMLLPLHHV